jgi:hypothetical protein
VEHHVQSNKVEHNVEMNVHSHNSIYNNIYNKKIQYAPITLRFCCERLCYLKQNFVCSQIQIGISSTRYIGTSSLHNINKNKLLGYIKCVE